MAVFDFLKKKELDEIEQLKSQIENYKSKSEVESEEIRQLRIQLEK